MQKTKIHLPPQIAQDILPAPAPGLQGNDNNLIPMGAYHYAAGPVQRNAKSHSPLSVGQDFSTAKVNDTGLPARLKSGIESLSGMALDNVNVHYDSPLPARIQAHAYAQGSEIHLAPGQARHLPHEAWHVVQQAQGRVKPTLCIDKNVDVNNDARLEREADRMGARALSGGNGILDTTAGLHNGAETSAKGKSPNFDASSPVQGVFVDGDVTYTQNAVYGIPLLNPSSLYVKKGDAGPVPPGYFQTDSEIELPIPLPVVPVKEGLPVEEKKGDAAERPKIKFDIYESRYTFNNEGPLRPNDCGMYAQALALNKETWVKETGLGEHLTGLTKPQTNADQYDPSEPATADNLSLDVGNTYRIDWDNALKKPAEKSAHHVATVVAKDGEDHVTSEADAGENLVKPRFAMYGTTSNTFWQKHHEYFTGVDKKPPFVSKYKKTAV
jgi:hypothetical protein